MDALILATLWCVIGAGIELTWPGETSGQQPWYLTPLCILSWPLVLAPQFLPLVVRIATLEDDDEG